MNVKLDRRFGKCPVRGCKFRRVVEGAYVGSESIFYRGPNRAELREIGCWCEDHNKPLVWNQLQGHYSPEKVCNGVCMGAVGPSCDCACGGENHGKNHVA